MTQNMMRNAAPLLMALLLAPPCLDAQTSGASPAGRQAPSLWEGLFSMLPMLVVFGVVMYLFAIRPQQKQERARREMLDNLKKNDRVVTAGGLHGTVNVIRNDTVLLTVADNVQLKFNKSAIQTVLKKAAPEDEESAPQQDSSERSS
ncbi:MAG: preprotein translocase subunit YajC [Planctomycetes bacterium]|nr:preprotein translocase subunit YajC [Planctomycetota bacterium]